MPTLLQITPEQDIWFTQEPSKTVYAKLNLKNITDTSAVAFKIKVTAPKSYSVKPKGGTIDVGQSIDVDIARFASPHDAGGKGSDRFLVVATAVDGALPPDNEGWKQLQKDDQTQENKLVVKLRAPNEDVGGDVAAGIYPAQPRGPGHKESSPDPAGFATEHCLKLENQVKRLQKDLERANKENKDLEEKVRSLRSSGGSDGDSRSLPSGLVIVVALMLVLFVIFIKS
eukprot:Selendium_serpulae@DN5895_c0_g1_i1.p3